MVILAMQSLLKFLFLINEIHQYVISWLLFFFFFLYYIWENLHSEIKKDLS